MILRNKNFDRRTLIRGAINGSMITLGLPILDMMLNNNGTALADGEELPKRFVLFFFGAGVSNDFFPTAFGKTWTLSTPLAALAPYKDQMNIISNVTVPYKGLDPHFTKVLMQLSGTNSVRNGHSYATIDQYLAEKLSTKQTYRSVQLRVSSSVDSDGIVPHSDILSYQRITGQSEMLPLAPELNPASAFNRIFGVPEKREYMAKVMLMNSLKDDCKKLMNVVGKSDKHLIDEYFGRVNDLATTIDAKYNSTCDSSVLKVDSKIDANNLDERMKVMSAITTLMLQCDLTRVVSILHSAPASSQIYPTVDPKNHHHGLTHDGAAAKLSKISGIIMNHLGTLVSSLANAAEGDKKLLQQTLVYAVSEETFPSHKYTKIPLMMIGGAGNSTYKTGFSVNAGTTTPVRGLLTALKALGIDPQDFPHDDVTIADKTKGHYAELF